MKKFIKYLVGYLKYHDEINHYYWYAVKHGYMHNENYNWLERTDYWWHAE